MRVRQTPISNDEFIARYREWRSLWKPTSEQIADEVSYLSKLAELMAPVPLSKATKADLRDFYWEERIRPQPRESRAAILSAEIEIDAFLDETRRRKTQRSPSPHTRRAC